MYPVGGTKPGILAEDITKLLVCRQDENNNNFNYSGISEVDLENHKKQINLDYFFQNGISESSTVSENNGLDVHDFHVAVHCQGQFAIRPYGTSTQVFPLIQENDITESLLRNFDFYIIFYFILFGYVENHFLIGLSNSFFLLNFKHAMIFLAHAASR